MESKGTKGAEGRQTAAERFRLSSDDVLRLTSTYLAASSFSPFYQMPPASQFLRGRNIGERRSTDSILSMISLRLSCLRKTNILPVAL